MALKQICIGFFGILVVDASPNRFTSNLVHVYPTHTSQLGLLPRAGFLTHPCEYAFQRF